MLLGNSFRPFEIPHPCGEGDKREQHDEHVSCQCVQHFRQAHGRNHDFQHLHDDPGEQHIAADKPDYFSLLQGLQVIEHGTGYRTSTTDLPKSGKSVECARRAANSQLRHCSVAGLTGLTKSSPAVCASSQAFFSRKYHFACMSASLISMREGPCARPSCCSSTRASDYSL